MVCHLNDLIKQKKRYIVFVSLIFVLFCFLHFLFGLSLHSLKRKKQQNIKQQKNQKNEKNNNNKKQNHEIKLVLQSLCLTFEIHYNTTNKQTNTIGLSGTSIKDPNKVITGFPSFSISSPVNNSDINLGYVHWSGIFTGYSTQYGRWRNDDSSDSLEGTIDKTGKKYYV